MMLGLAQISGAIASAIVLMQMGVNAYSLAVSPMRSIVAMVSVVLFGGWRSET
jgi:hypothetical protein